jgi:hypothetical protein
MMSMMVVVVVMMTMSENMFKLYTFPQKDNNELETGMPVISSEQDNILPYVCVNVQSALNF